MSHPNIEAQADFTFLTCTYNRDADLRDLLNSVMAQKSGDFTYEILVVDNNSKDQTRAVVQEFVERYPALVRYLFEPRQGKSYALNAGLQAARGRVYVIADDDLVYPPDYLLKLANAFRERPHAVVIAGKVLPLWKEAPPNWLTPKHWSAIAMSDYGDVEFSTGRNKDICLLAAAYRRDHVLRVNGYNLELGVAGSRIGGVEDADIMNRLYTAGYQGVYRPEIEVFHKVEAHRTTRAYHRRWHRGHGRQHATMKAAASGEPAGLRLLGVPGYMFKGALRDAAAYVRNTLQGRGETAFYYEARLWFFSGFVAETIRQRSRRDTSASS